MGIQPKTPLLTLLIAACIAVCGVSCGRSEGPARKIEPTYNKKSGRLELLRYDSDGDGIYDTFSYMDGARIVRIEIDKNEDGKIDRWEHYGTDRKLEKIGFSRLQDGVEDAWAIPNANGIIDRMEISTKRDGRIDRVEYYDKDVLVRAEEDTDGDGKIDKWETYDGQLLATVSFDTTHSGKPDRRLVYAKDGSVRLETDPQGTGQFVVVNAK